MVLNKHAAVWISQRVHRAFITICILTAMAVDKGQSTPKGAKEVKGEPWTLREVGGKTVWDWLQLLIVPLMLVLITVVFTWQQDARQQEIEDQRAQDQALQAYLDQTAQLLIEKDLRSAQPEDNISVVTRARTLTILGRVDGARKRSVLLFLYESGLIYKGDELVIDLSGANLSDAQLNGAHLPRVDFASSGDGGAVGPYSEQIDSNDEATLPDVDLSGADLRGAVLTGASLTNADLADADLSGAVLDEANLEGVRGITANQLYEEASSLEGATMPSGRTS